MTRKEKLYDRLEELGVDERMKIALCNYFPDHTLEDFVEFLEDEF